MQELLSKIQTRERRDTMSDEMDMMQEEGTQDVEALRTQLTEHLGALPENVKRAVAAHLTPEFAKLVGAIVGSEPLANALGSMADPNLALVPMPREQAMELAQQAQAQQGPAQPAAPAPTAPPAPSGPMGM
jgi:hypothetical protein